MHLRFFRFCTVRPSVQRTESIHAFQCTGDHSKVPPPAGGDLDTVAVPWAQMIALQDLWNHTVV